MPKSKHIKIYFSRKLDKHEQRTYLTVHIHNNHDSLGRVMTKDSEIETLIRIMSNIAYVI